VARHEHQRRDADFEKAVTDCVVRSAGDVTLDKMRESPDADLLHKGGYHVGLEIVRTVNHKDVEGEKRIQVAAERVRQELDGKDVRGKLRIIFDLADMGSGTESVHRAWRREVPSKIAAFVKSHPDGSIDKQTLKTNGITRIACIEWSQAPRTSVLHGWRSFTRKGATLADTCLANKDKRLCYYRTLNGDHFREYWLAIAGYGAGTLEDGGFSMLLNRSYNTEYDRVFLMEYGAGSLFVKAIDVTPVARNRP